MSRHRDGEDSDQSEPDDDTDTDSEYEGNVSNNRTPYINTLYIQQRGVCRVSNLAFGEGLYSPTLVPRCTRKPLSESNSMLVISMVEQMHSAVPNMPWRAFAVWLKQIGERAEM